MCIHIIPRNTLACVDQMILGALSLIIRGSSISDRMGHEVGYIIEDQQSLFCPLLVIARYLHNLTHG